MQPRIVSFGPPVTVYCGGRVARWRATHATRSKSKRTLERRASREVGASPIAGSVSSLSISRKGADTAIGVLEIGERRLGSLEIRDSERKQGSVFEETFNGGVTRVRFID